MDSAQREEIVERLAARYRTTPTSPAVQAPMARPEEALRQIVEAGASRFGVRADRPEQNGFDACSLAPPLARLIDHTALKPETTEDDI
ncbi:MAG: hypothetical protein KJO98_17015, partial [Rhodothermia bacterium]|nr:hypothetical protein [Rhodothermia bacterium]